jgi:predicted acylesterase/phospholipase RssA
MDETQELRIALVMNGGVSLAVWMGGVTRELDRVRRGDGAYGELLRLTRADARIDVIAGASAGGINGAVLGLAIARGASVEDIRELWMDEGSIADLLRDPENDDAPSVLQGDARLLDGLRKAMEQLEQSGTGAKADPDAPLNLVITGTPLEGQVTRYPDRFGATIADVNHRALFHFGDADFAAAGAGDRLALAARSSASFPGAFEPSFVPVRGGADPTHPDMRGIADFDGPRWLIDGGVLDNTPFRPALDVIRKLPAQAPVRRVLGYVVPEPLAPEPKNAEHGQTPGVVDVVLAALSKIPRVQSIGRELQEIEDNNSGVRRRRESRTNTLLSTPPEELERTAQMLLPAYVETRRKSAAYDIAGLLLEGASTPPDGAAVGRVRATLAEADAPWLPPTGELSVDPWRWGLAPVVHAGNVALDLLQRLVALRGLEPDIQQEAMTLRGLLHQLLGMLRAVDAGSAEHWRTAADEAFASDDAVASLLSEWDETFSRRLGGIASGIASVVVTANVLLSESSVSGEYADQTRQLARALAGDGQAEALRRLLALDVVQRSAGADLADVEQPVELVLMSADAPCSFGAPKTAAEKLAGLQFHHFGGFYKRSWRANDWMWGRMDGADRLIRMILDPRRIQRRLSAGETPEALAEEIRAVACEGDPILAEGWSDAVLDELRDLAAVGDAEPSPTALNATYEAIRTRVQLEILSDEIPGVIEAAREDLAQGTASDAAGATWAAELDPPLDTAAAIDAFATCKIAEERIGDERDSKYFKRVATKGAAVGGAVATDAIPDRGLARFPHRVLGWLRWALRRAYRRNR